MLDSILPLQALIQQPTTSEGSAACRLAVGIGLARPWDVAAALLADANGMSAEPEALQGNADDFWGLCKNWFSSRADRITLKQGLHNIDAAAEQVVAAYGDLGSACDALATDPPDVGTARDHNANAIAAVKLANPQFTKAFKQLHSLQR